MKSQESKGPRTFEIVTRTRKVAGAAHRKVQGGTMSPSGRFRINANGTEIWEDVVRESKLDPETVAVQFGVDVENHAVAAYPVKGGLLGATRVIPAPDHASVVMHLVAVLEKYPQLASESHRSVLVSRDTDAAGVPYLLIDLQTAMVKPQSRRSRSSASKSSSAQSGSAKPISAIASGAPAPAAPTGAGATTSDSTTATTSGTTATSAAPGTGSTVAPAGLSTSPSRPAP